VARRVPWPALTATVFLLTGCSLELDFHAPAPGPEAGRCAACQAGNPAQKPEESSKSNSDQAADKSKSNGDQAGDKSKSNGDQAAEESGKEKEKPKQPKPHTLPQALCAYWECLRTHGCTAEQDKDKDKDKDKGEEKDKGKGEEKAKEGANNQGAGGKGENGEKNPPAAGEKDKGREKQGSNNQERKAGGEQGEKGEKNPPANGEKDKAKENGGKGEGDKGKEEKDKDKDKEKDKEKEEEPEEAWYSAHAQATVVTQEHPRFNSPYIGAHSLLPDEPSATSMTGTLFLDYRLCEYGGNSTELVFNPEIAGGRGFSGVQGVAGFPNGEITRVGTVEPTPYIARLFLRQTCCLGDEVEKVEDEANQIAGTRPVDRLTFTIGKMAATDIVDDNLFSHDPRTQFLNWSLMYNGAWDYPANVRGYTYGFAFDYNRKDWALRYGIFAEPAVANGAEFDPRFLKANGQVLEWEGRYTANDQPGKLRLLAYLNHAHMGDYREAIQEMPVDPDITQTRAYRFKYGFGLNWQQNLTKDLGVYSRLGWNDGHTESWAFTEIDRTAALGVALKGRCWCRPDDVVGLAGVLNGISKDHRDYLAAGGLGFILGDGRLNYGLEEILEMYYDFQVIKGMFVTADWQGINHPAYNRDRGPVAVGTLRVHIEF
jgi:high affinity Mn2+ porin